MYVCVLVLFQSLSLNDYFPKIRLTVSIVIKSVCHNLEFLLTHTGCVSLRASGADGNSAVISAVFEDRISASQTSVCPSSGNETT